MSRDDEIRRAILARRAKFIAAALAGSGLAGGACDKGSPAVCLSPAMPTTTTTSAPPADASATTTSTSPALPAPPSGTAAPRACLSLMEPRAPEPPPPVAPPHPRVCLSPLPPKKLDR